MNKNRILLEQIKIINPKFHDEIVTGQVRFDTIESRMFTTIRKLCIDAKIEKLLTTTYPEYTSIYGRFVPSYLDILTLFKDELLRQPHFSDLTDSEFDEIWDFILEKLKVKYSSKSTGRQAGLIIHTVIDSMTLIKKIKGV